MRREQVLSAGLPAFHYGGRDRGVPVWCFTPEHGFEENYSHRSFFDPTVRPQWRAERPDHVPADGWV
jgi:hypothetical protein